VEPIQGEGGINIPTPGYLKALKELCRRRDLLLIYDEVQVGMGRTGTLFAYEHDGVAPDVMTLAKALANGLPMGAMLATDDAAKSFMPGTHATTFGGGPLVSSAALETVKILSNPAFLENVRNTGAYLVERLGALKAQFPQVKDIRGRGLMVGMELDRPGQPIVRKCLDRGLVINCTHETVLRFVPPLVAGRAEVDAMIGVLGGVFSEEFK
jgi:acetylornithine/N-succinyldiaminopimelate aminotransferase